MIESDLKELGCEKSYPPALNKACVDHFQYGARLKTGEFIEFSAAEAMGPDWVRLIDPIVISEKMPLNFNPERGIEVRVDQIAWVIDAPYGS